MTSSRLAVGFVWGTEPTLDVLAVRSLWAALRLLPFPLTTWHFSGIWLKIVVAILLRRRGLNQPGNIRQCKQN